MTNLSSSAPIESVYVVEPENQGWIIERLMRDLTAQLQVRGISTRIGPASAYGGEHVVFNSRYLTPLHDKRARVNSLFITHVDDRIREAELCRSFSNFDSFVCMSPHDADFVGSLKGNSDGVFGMALPPRDLNVRPIRLAIFSAFYEDKRKNEEWILDYFKSRPQVFRAEFIVSFLGSGWAMFAHKLSKLDINFEIYNYSRYLPDEYNLYKRLLAGCNALLYLGFDGGAMSVYDGIAAGIEVIASNISYHRDLGENVRLFDDQIGFFAELDRLRNRRTEREEKLKSRSMEQYADALLAHWNCCVGNGTEQVIAQPNKDVVNEFRRRYRKIDYTRLRSAMIRFLQYILQ